MTRCLFILLLFLTAVAALAQPAADNAAPWLTWQPPQVTLPQPNGFDSFLAAMQLKDRIDAQLGLGGNPPPPPQPGVPEDRWHVGPPDLPVPERVALYAEVLVLVRQGLRQDFQIPPPVDMNEQLPYLRDFRTLVRLLAMEGEAKRLESDYGFAAQSALDALNVAQACTTQRILISGMVGIACEAMAFASLDETIPGLSSAQCQTVRSLLQETERVRIPVEEWLVGEEVLSRAHFKQIALDPNKRAEVLAELKQQPEFAADAEKILGDLGPEGWNEIGEAYAGFREYVALPHSKRPAKPAAPDNVFMQLLVPSIAIIGFRSDQVLNNFRLHQAELAARAYLLDKDQLPPSLTALVPDYLPAVPADPFGDGPLHSKAAPNCLTLYSVGPDGVDDGGRPPADEFVNSETKGDIIVLVSQAK